MTPREARSRCQVRIYFPPSLGGGVQPSGTQSGWSQPTPPQTFLFWRLELPCSFGLNNPSAGTDLANQWFQNTSGSFCSLHRARDCQPLQLPDACGSGSMPCHAQPSALICAFGIRAERAWGPNRNRPRDKRGLGSGHLGLHPPCPLPRPQDMPTRPSVLCSPPWGEQHSEGEGMSGA